MNFSRATLKSSKVVVPFEICLKDIAELTKLIRGSLSKTSENENFSSYLRKHLPGPDLKG